MKPLANQPVYPVARETFKTSEARMIHACDGGMTLREYYAGLAMQGILANSHEDGFTADEEASAKMVTWEDFAKGAVQMADALIAELEKKEVAP